MGKRTQYVYDAADQQVEVIRPDLGKVTTTYDNAGRVASVTNHAGRTTSYDYDQDGRVVEVTRPDNSTEVNAYDLAGNLVTVTNAANQDTTYEYDAVGRVIRTEDPDGRVTTRSYDVAGNVTRLDVPGPGYVDYLYDELGQLTTIDYSDSTPDVTYTYDALGREITMTDATGTSTTAYDAHGNITSHTRGGKTLEYLYDGNDNLFYMVYPESDYDSKHRAVIYDHDDVGQLTGVSDWRGSAGYQYTWNKDGQVESLKYPHGVVTTYEYNTNGYLSRSATWQGTPPASGTGLNYLDLSYNHNSDGLLSSSPVRRDNMGRQGGAYTSYVSSHDQLDQITGFYVTSTQTFPDINASDSYTYNAAGAITNHDPVGSMAYTPGGQLTTLTEPDGVTTFTYDQRGNRTGQSKTTSQGTENTTYTYDLANRLTSITQPSSSPRHYTYFGDGLRAGHNSTPTYTWDITNDIPLLLEDSEYYYIYGLGNTPLTQIDRWSDDYLTHLHSDLLGSVRMTTQENTWTFAVTGDSDYTPYGLAIPHNYGTVASATRFGYAGEYTDSTGLIYLRNRYYDPKTAQFLTVDPLLDETGEPYAYAGNNPLQNTDPLGLFCMFGHNPDGGCRGGRQYSWTVMNLNPAYGAVEAFFIQAEMVEQGCSNWEVAKQGAKAVGLGVLGAFDVVSPGPKGLAKIGSRLTPNGTSIPSKLPVPQVEVKGGLNLYKMGTPQSLRTKGWRDGDYFLSPKWMGNAKDTWKGNSGLLRQEMRKGKPIYDSYVNDAGQLIPTGGFLGMERNLLINRGWTFDPGIGAWVP